MCKWYSLFRRSFIFISYVDLSPPITTLSSPLTAHGPRQDARACQGPSRRSDSPADGGTVARRRVAFGRNGARLFDRLRRLHVAPRAPHDLLRRLRRGRVQPLRPLGLLRLVPHLQVLGSSVESQNSLRLQTTLPRTSVHEHRSPIDVEKIQRLISYVVTI